MKLKKFTASLSVLATTGLMANDNISYDYMDLSYGYSGSSLIREDTYRLDGSYSINDNFYLTASIDRLLIDNKSGTNGHNTLGRTIYDFSLGFHKGITNRTDFYAELGYEYSKLSVPINDVFTSDFGTYKYNYDNLFASIGTRTAFTEKFELTAELKYTNRIHPYYVTFENLDNNIYSDTFGNKDLNLSILGLYKLNTNNAIKFGVDGSAGFTVGWRYNWK